MSKRTGRMAWMVGGAMAAMVASAASAQQVLSFENCDNDGDVIWYMNGNQELMDDWRSLDSWCLHLPPEAYWGVVLSTDNPSSGLLGDLTQHASLRVSFDLRNFLFINFFGDPIDPESRPIILELHDEGDPENWEDNVSVWFRGLPMPSMDDGWVHYEMTIPVPAGSEMPEGWSGTGDEDPVTFEPRLPAGRTFRSVLQNVTQVRISTFEPGYFYTFSGIEFGADNIKVEAFGGTTCPCDIDGGGLGVTDIFAYLTLWFANDPRADFNGGGIGVDDIFAFLTCWFAGCDA
ncbi:MAG: hypothetical protein KF699_02130 [Phycisphaeraceae bacterium]|nr:hypothetical protein [Phycisphaeraceae bacterium]